ncbi:MAG: proton glutamate symport protein [Planctomycetota bacterium]|jgi:proton glutamate symport protein
MKFHWKVLIWMLAGVLAGVGIQQFTTGDAWDGATWEEVDGGLRLKGAKNGSPADKSKLDSDQVVVAAVLRKGREGEESFAITDLASWTAVLGEASNGDVVWVETASEGTKLMTLGMDPSSQRASWIYPFDFIADIFMALLKMLIVPVVLTSIISGIAGVGSMGDLKRLGGKTFLYYVGTSILAILLGQALVSIVKPGVGAELGLTQLSADEVAPDESFLEVLKRMVPSNIFESMGSNAQMLQVIFFALIFGFFITRTVSPHRERVSGMVNSLFAVVMNMAEGVLTLLPYGVFALMVRVVAKTGFAVFEPLLVYMAVVTGALLLHACVTLPLILRFVGGISPLRWAKAMSPAIMTAFSTSSSSMTLPVTLETVEKRGRVSNRVTSFTLPLGATINMDGTALYECIGVVFLAQYYGGAGGFELTLANQGTIVVMALLASIGAAGIPSAGLVMMLSILAVLKLPLEGAALLLAVDRPLDMLRTVVNVWSDSCGAAVIARTEGEIGPSQAGEPLPSPEEQPNSGAG